MTTKIEKNFDLPEPIEKVWSYFADPTKIVSCVPGASLTEKVDDKNFKGKVIMKFGPVKVKYNGEIEIQELEEANHKLRLKGKGIDAKGKGSADMQMLGTLKSMDGGTAVNFEMEISITGMLAQFGARLINEVTNQVLDQFVTNFKTKLSEDTISSATADLPPTAKAVANTGIKEATTEEKAKALSDSAAAVRKAVEDVKQAQEAVSTELKQAGIIASTRTAKMNSANSTVEIPKEERDNSLNAFSIMVAVVKGWFSRLFGGEK